MPSAAPPMVAMASETSGRLPPGSEPSSSSSPAWLVTAIRVPAVSKKSTKSMVAITSSSSGARRSPKAAKAAPKVGASDGGAATMALGASRSPKASPTAAVAMMP